MHEVNGRFFYLSLKLYQLSNWLLMLSGETAAGRVWGNRHSVAAAFSVQEEGSELLRGLRVHGEHVRRSLFRPALFASQPQQTVLPRGRGSAIDEFTAKVTQILLTWWNCKLSEISLKFNKPLNVLKRFNFVYNIHWYFTEKRRGLVLVL